MLVGKIIDGPGDTILGSFVTKERVFNAAVIFFDLRACLDQLCLKALAVMCNDVATRFLVKANNALIAGEEVTFVLVVSFFAFCSSIGRLDFILVIGLVCIDLVLDNAGKQLITELIEFARNENVQHKLLFLENYDIGMARYLVQGVDVWLNTPRRPQEASGTSGMKAAINGVINCSILDGWWAEAYDGFNGWAIEGNDYYTEDEDRDNFESQQLFNVLENEVIPCFYERIGGELPLRWIARMKASIATGLGCFSSARMVEEYKRKYYQPAASAYDQLIKDNAAAAGKLVMEKGKLVENFYGNRLYIGNPAVGGNLDQLHVGDRIPVSVEVYLGGMSPEEIEVDAYSGAANAHNEIVEGAATPLKLVEDRGNGNFLYGGEIICRASGRFGLTARIKAAGDAWDNSVPGFMCWPK